MWLKAGRNNGKFSPTRATHRKLWWRWRLLGLQVVDWFIVPMTYGLKKHKQWLELTKSINQSSNQSIKQSINQAINQCFIQSKSINQSINRPIKQWISQCINQSMNQRTAVLVLAQKLKHSRRLGSWCIDPFLMRHKWLWWTENGKFYRWNIPARIADAHEAVEQLPKGTDVVQVINDNHTGKVRIIPTENCFEHCHTRSEQIMRGKENRAPSYAFSHCSAICINCWRRSLAVLEASRQTIAESSDCLPLLKIQQSQMFSIILELVIRFFWRRKKMTSYFKIKCWAIFRAKNDFPVSDGPQMITRLFSVIREM